MHKEITSEDVLQVLRVFHEEILDYEDGAAAVAKAIKRPYSTMMRELNPNDGQAKLGVAEWLAIMGVTHKFDSLRQIAELFGFRLEPAATALEA